MNDQNQSHDTYGLDVDKVSIAVAMKLYVDAASEQWERDNPRPVEGDIIEPEQPASHCELFQHGHIVANPQNGKTQTIDLHLVADDSHTRLRLDLGGIRRLLGMLIEVESAISEWAEFQNDGRWDLKKSMNQWHGRRSTIRRDASIRFVETTKRLTVEQRSEILANGLRCPSCGRKLQLCECGWGAIYDEDTFED